MISLSVKRLKSWRDKIIGMIGEKKPQILLFYTRFGIHTFGLKFPIDILILDQKMRVVKIREGLHVNRLFFWNPHYGTVIELPQGTIKSNNLKIGETINLKITNP